MNKSSAPTSVNVDTPDPGQLAKKLEHDGFVIEQPGVPVAVLQELSTNLAALSPGSFHDAAIGHGSTEQYNSFVRRSRISWLDHHSAFLPHYTKWTEQLRVAINQQCLLGLFSFESHYACYDPGGFYRRHLDSFRGQRNRVVSVIIYLNEIWQPSDGGELVLYPTTTAPVTVLPTMGTLVMFLSENLPHEVLPAGKERVSVAGWFRLNNFQNTASGRML